jgi:hypothetical protein
LRGSQTKAERLNILQIADHVIFVSEWCKTKFFEDLGWDGFCVEPQPNEYEKLVSNRNCKTLNGVISDINQKQVEFCKISGYSNMLSGILEYYNESHKQRILSEIQSIENNSKEKITANNYNFNNVIEQTNIDLLCIDTEGGEDRILNSIDFSKYNINVILFEDNYNNLYDNLKSDIKERYKKSPRMIGPDVVLKKIDLSV